MLSKTQSLKYLYIYCTTGRCNFIRDSMEWAFKTVFCCAMFFLLHLKVNITVTIFCDNSMIQWKAVITRSNMIRFCINDCRTSGRISIKRWFHKRLSGRAMGCLLWFFFENWPLYNSSALYQQKEKIIYLHWHGLAWFCQVKVFLACWAYIFQLFVTTICLDLV